jgi:probable F420-dependent oxidoreductase
MTRPFRFGVVCGAPDANGWKELARRVESLGYSVLLSSDHLDLGGAHFSTLSALPALAAAASVTSQVRVGVSVINHDLHHPAVLAREAATLDILSDGRFELGLGAGWAQYEYEWAGIPFDPPGRRVSRFAEYVAVVKALMSEDVVDYRGDYFQIDGMPRIPRPLQRPRPPIMIGATGKRMISLAAREADIVSINLSGAVPGTPAAMDERIRWIREAASSGPS